MRTTETLPELPADRRKPIAERIDAIGAAPSTCKNPCKLCGLVSRKVANAVLFVWDDLARTGVWPIRNRDVHTILHGSGVYISAIRIGRFLGHRRYHVLQRMIRAEIKASIPSPMISKAP
jgi:hypothetical protein